MAKHNETGIKGEQLAENFLLNNGYTILYRNWCTAKMEVDLVALKNDIIVFAEVKTRHSTFFGFPEDAVTPKKQDLLKTAAAVFLDEHIEYLKIQFDIISIILQNGELKEIQHFEDAF